jgi:AcrR family transcriptional regulator
MASVNTKEKILFNAFKLFLKKGFTDVSINDIIKKAGISKGGFFHYFKSKDHLLREIIRNYIFTAIEDFAKRIIDSGESAYDKLKAYLGIIPKADQHIREILNDNAITYRSFYLLMMEGIKKFSYFRNEYTKIFSRIYSLIRNELLKAQVRGEIIPDLDIDAVSYSILVSYEGSLHIWVIQPDMDLVHLNKQLFDTIWNSIKMKG